jgi:hypothetical protein
MDTTGVKAVGPEEDYINYLMRDTTKNGPAIAYYHALLGGYFANTAKNLDSAVAHFELAVRYDQANDQYKKYYDILKKALDRQNAKKNGTTAAPAPPAGDKQPASKPSGAKQK